MTASLAQAAETVRDVLTQAGRGLVEREVLVELVALAAVAGEHLLVVGPPGTAKSEAVRRVARAFGGRYFEYLLGRFTEPSEIFGPVDLRRLREGAVETETRDMLPEADIAFLDEVFLGSTAILNTLLALLNERTFRRGHTRLDVPLRVCVGASNALPTDPTLAAFADRFLLHAYVEPVADPLLESLLESGWSLRRPAAPAQAPLETLDLLARASLDVDLAPVRPRLAEIVRTLRAAGLRLTDRRVVKLQRLIAAAAALSGREGATPADLWPVLHAIPSAEGQQLGREVLRDLLDGSDSAVLVRAAAASRGPLARERLLLASAPLLDQPPEDEPGRRAWRLAVEGLAREIDAGFARESLSAELAALRQRAVEVLGGPG